MEYVQVAQISPKTAQLANLMVSSQPASTAPSVTSPTPPPMPANPAPSTVPTAPIALIPPAPSAYPIPSPLLELPVNAMRQPNSTLQQQPHLIPATTAGIS